MAEVSSHHMPESIAALVSGLRGSCHYEEHTLTERRLLLEARLHERASVPDEPSAYRSVPTIRADFALPSASELSEEGVRGWPVRLPASEPGDSSGRPHRPMTGESAA